jgi:dihydrofolate synthase/folylpolyglutamate synthase
MDYAAARVALERLPRFEVKPGLERIGHLLEALGHPERAYPAIHVAGTNGKGSVVAMLDAILRSAGYRVGRFTSPEVLDFRDRIAVDGEWLNEAAWASGVERLLPVMEGMSDCPAQFEAVTALALDAFDRAGVDVAVVEVGLGGRFDATNLVRPILSILTNVAFDHTAILGAEIERIAWEKAGIAREGVPMVTGSLTEVVRRIVEGECADVGAEVHDATGIPMTSEGTEEGRALYRVERPGLPDRVELALLGGYQRENLAIALRSVEILCEQGMTLSSEAILDGLCSVSWPGRFEVVRRLPTVILEGAHNVAGAEALAWDVERFVPDRRRRRLLFGAFADKDVAGMLAALGPAFPHLALTASANPRALPVDALAALADELRLPHACYDSVASALGSELDSGTPEDVWFVAGSLSVVAEARRWLEGEG